MAEPVEQITKHESKVAENQERKTYLKFKSEPLEKGFSVTPKSDLNDEGLRETIQKTAGTDNVLLAATLIEQVGKAAIFTTDPKMAVAILDSLFIAMREIEPRDEIEGMLAGQMVATHSQAMEFLRLANINRTTPEQARVHTNIANQFLKTYLLQIEALTKYRRKAEQTVRVEHVHVHEGGQAIVGNVNNTRGGGARDE